MALSKSFQRGQVPLLCQMCEESNEIKWKCLLCDFLLCTKCQTLHKKVKSTDQHTIIDIKDIATYQQQTKDKVDFSNIPCGIHSGQTCFLYCQSCEVVVCPLCITKIHEKHKMIEFAQGYELTMKTVKTFNSEIEEELVRTVKVLTELGIIKSSEYSKYDLEKQKILSRGKDLKAEVEKETNKLLKELDQRKETLMNSVNDAEIRSEKIKADLDFRKKNLSLALKSNNANQSFSIQSEEKKSRNKSIEHVNTVFKTLPIFVPGKNVVQVIYLGSFVETDDDKKQFEFKVIKQYKTKFSTVENLVCCGDSSMWISPFYGNKLQKMKVTNESLHKMHTFGLDIYNMILLPSGDLLLSTRESNHKILSCTTNKMESTKFSVNPLITLAVHVTSNNKIFVGVRENQPTGFPVNGPRKVIMMNMDGTKEIVYHNDNKGKPIFTVPYRITSDSDTNIYVIDLLNVDWAGRIVALDRTSGVRWIYSGNTDINKKQTLKPADLVATRSDNIIITDSKHDMIHILNTSGLCIHYLNTKDQLNIKLPFSLDIDDTGALYIGCDTNNPLDKGKIYTVQISGF